MVSILTSFFKRLIQKAEEEAADSNEKQISRRHIEKHIQVSSSKNLLLFAVL